MGFESWAEGLVMLVAAKRVRRAFVCGSTVHALRRFSCLGVGGGLLCCAVLCRYCAMI